MVMAPVIFTIVNITIIFICAGTPEFDSKLEEALFVVQSSDMCYATTKVFVKLLEIYITTEGETSVEENLDKLIGKLKYDTPPNCNDCSSSFSII